MTEIQVQKSLLINLPADEIFAYVCNLENMVDWSSTIISMRKTSPGETRVGSIIRSTIRFLGRWLNVVFEIVEYSPGHCLALKSIAGSPPCHFCYQWESQEGGGTLVSHEAMVQIVGGDAEQASPVIASALARQLEYDLQTLKELLESGLILV